MGDIFSIMLKLGVKVLKFITLISTTNTHFFRHQSLIIGIEKHNFSDTLQRIVY